MSNPAPILLEQFSRFARAFGGRLCLRMGPIPGEGKIARGLPLSFADQYLGSDHLWRAAGSEACDLALIGQFDAFERILDSGIPVCGTRSLGNTSLLDLSLAALRSGAAPATLAPKIAAARISTLWQPDGSIFPREAFEALALCPDPAAVIAASPSARLNLTLFVKALESKRNHRANEFWDVSFEVASLAKALVDSGPNAPELIRLLRTERPKLSFADQSLDLSACILRSMASTPKPPDPGLLAVLAELPLPQDAAATLGSQFLEFACHFSEFNPAANPPALLAGLRALRMEEPFLSYLREAVETFWASKAAPILAGLEQVSIDESSAPARPSTRRVKSL